MIGTWVIMIYLCNPNLSPQCSYHLFGPTYTSQQECVADLAKLPRTRVIRGKECMELEAPRLIFTKPS